MPNHRDGFPASAIDNLSLVTCPTIRASIGELARRPFLPQLGHFQEPLKNGRCNGDFSPIKGSRYHPYVAIGLAQPMRYSINC